MSLATKYRPTEFNEVLGQDTKTIETKLLSGEFPHAVLFSGITGGGKSTIAKIVASKLNAFVYELDVASHNSIDDIKTVCEMVKTKPIGYDNLVIILDEVHRANNVNTLQPLLITLETLPKYAYIIMCTTNPEKLLSTIRNRCVEYKLNAISKADIVARLTYICDNEGILYDNLGLEAIADNSYGSMRQAIANLETISSEGATIKIVNKQLFKASFDTMLDVIYAYLDNDIESLLYKVEEIDNIELFVQRFFTFILDIEIYLKTNKKDLTNIPNMIYNAISEFNDCECKMINGLLGAIFKLQFEGKNSPILKELFIATIIIKREEV